MAQLACRARRVVWVVLALIALWSLPASAAVTIPTPRGWSRAGVSPDARARADAWAARAGGKVDTIATPRSEDESTEILAVVELAGALPADALAADAGAPAHAALLYDAQALLEIEGDPADSGRVELSNSPLAAIWGRWDAEGDTYFVALAPDGRTHVAIVLATPSHNTVLYESVFAELLQQITGATASLVPFPVGRWITIAIVGWVLAAAVVTFAIARILLHLGPWGVALRSAGALSGAALVVGAIVFPSVGAETTELTAAGVSPAWLAFEVAGGGFAAGVLLLVGAQILERGRKPVSSAPSDGAFAPRPISSVMDARRSPGPAAEQAPTPPVEAVPMTGPHLDPRSTPIVGVPILPALGERLTAEARTNRPTAAAGSMGGASEQATVRDFPPPPGEPPARLTPAHEPGVPQPLDFDPSRPARLETEQILIDRRGPKKPSS